MPGHWFFLSYARRDAVGNPYLKRFHDQLATEVGRVAGLPSSVGAEDIGFLDVEGIEPGHQWPDTLARALQGSRTMLCLYSRAYFSSEYCGREVQVFRDRLAAHAAAHPADPVPPLMIPVLWSRPEPTAVPPALASTQHSHESFGAVYAREGLYQLMSLSKYRDHYRELLVSLAETIVRAADAQPLAELPDLPHLEHVKSAFSSSTGTTGGARGHGTGAVGPGTARFVFVAARRGELDVLGAPEDVYGPEGGRDWCPYAPTEPTPVGVVSQRVAALENVFYETLPLADRLLDQLREAERTNTIVVIVVDPWSIRSETYQRYMLHYDEASFVNCGVLIPWPRGDDEPAGVRDALDAAVRQTFSRAFILNGSYIRSSIHSVDDLQKELIAVLSEVRRRMVQRAQVFLPRQMGPEMSLPTISGPGAGAP